ncbi:MAG: hypothetical protein DHS20C20_21840 [Ardenticatenaceae bacterium]|nr:MAG: hypothetical protein DHS20C20_21840 [Ardenticatenaceae bacterium]
MKFAPLSLNDIVPWADLLATAFDRQPDQMAQLLHFLQPETNLIACGAWDGAELVAQYSCLLRELYLPMLERCVPVGLSINMAVHPDYRGQGLVKQVANPVYETLAARGVVAGAGFSNAAGVQVDKRSAGYGYEVVGRLRPYLLWLHPQKQCPDFYLTDQWPNLPFLPVEMETAVQFAWTPDSLKHRFACHPFRSYRFGVWQQGGSVAGLVVYRPIRLIGLTAVALLAAHSSDLAELLRRCVGAMAENGYRLAHLVGSPATPLLAVLRETAVCLPQPISRNPYYLTLKPLSPDLPHTAFCFENWSCLGGDVL